jgi:hypothetical protein
MPRVDALRKLVQIERLKQDSVELIARKQDIIDLNSINTSQLTTILDLRTQITTFNIRVSNYEEQIEALNKDLKKEKNKRKWTSVAAIVSTVGGIVATAFILK